MKYVPSAFVGRLSRSAGSTTASHNKFGAYLRNRVMPTNPQTSFQTGVRTSFSDLSTAWRGLTAAQREAWIAVGESFSRTDSLGQPYTLTGLQAFLAVNINRLTYGGAALLDAPTYQLPDAPTILTATMDASAGTVSVVHNLVPSGEFMAIYATRPMSAGRNFAPGSEYKLIAVLDDSALSPATLGAEYISRFGAITGKTGEKVFWRSVSISDPGFRSTPLQSSTIIVA